MLVLFARSCAFLVLAVAALPAMPVPRATRKPSFARLSPLARGRIIGMREAGAQRDVILKKVKKKDGKATSLQTVDSVLARFAEDPEWDGVEVQSLNHDGEGGKS